MRKIIILMCFVAMSCQVQNDRGSVTGDVEKDSAGLRTINVDSQLTLFGVVRGVFTGNNNAVCIDRLTPGDVWPLLLRIKDPNSPNPQGMPAESQIPKIQQGNSSVNINVQTGAQ